MAASNSCVVAPQPARLEEGGADRHVLLRQRDQLGDRADRMADLELQVPQQVKHRLGSALLLRRRRLRGQEHEVEIAEGRHLAAAGPAEPDQREALAGGWSRRARRRNRRRGGRAGRGGKRSPGRRRGHCRARRDETPRDFRAAGGERVAQRMSVASRSAACRVRSAASRSASARRSMIARWSVDVEQAHAARSAAIRLSR